LRRHHSKLIGDVSREGRVESLSETLVGVSSFPFLVPGEVVFMYMKVTFLVVFKNNKTLTASGVLE